VIPVSLLILIKLPSAKTAIAWKTQAGIMVLKLVGTGILVLFSIFATPLVTYGQLTVTSESGNPPILTFKGKPVRAYGPSPQHILTYLPRGNGEDYADWLDWAVRFGYGNVRSYPPSIVVNPPAINLFERASVNPDKFNLNQFNDAYFRELRKACRQFERAGIVVHLQFWQSVHWKKKWTENYYNPLNNVNPEIAAHAGPQEFSTIANPLLLKHQIAYVHRVIDATADIGNVFYDIMNEIGNGTAANREWVDVIISAIRQKEKEDGIRVLLTLNDEGGRRMGDFSIAHPHLDLIIKDSGRYSDHVETFRQFGKPTVSVRNIDFNAAKKQRLYFYGSNNLEINKDSLLQTRGRKYWWRMYMARVAAAAGYADSVSIADTEWVPRLASKLSGLIGWSDSLTHQRKAAYRLNTLAETHFKHFNTFVEDAGDPTGLRPAQRVVIDHPVANSYCLHNDARAIIYLESPNGEAGHHYPPGHATIQGLSLHDGVYNMRVYQPDSGQQSNVKVDVHQGRISIRLPAFRDDLALLIH